MRVLRSIIDEKTPPHGTATLYCVILRTFLARRTTASVTLARPTFRCRIPFSLARSCYISFGPWREIDRTFPACGKDPVMTVKAVR